MTRKIRYSFPGIRAFIYGVEVTKDISSVNINWTDERTPGTAEILLQSELDRYIVNANDVAALYADIPLDSISTELISYAENQGFDIINPAAGTDLDRALDVIRSRIVEAVKDTTKREVLLSKFSVRVTGKQAPPGFNLREIEQELGQKSATIRDIMALRGEFPRYPFQDGQCIFHSGDPVRVFLRSPFNPTEWFYGATGYVSDWKERMDKTGLRTVTITVEDSLRLLRLARLTTNPSIYDIEVLKAANIDAILRTWYQDNLANLSLPELLFVVLFGKESGINKKRLKVSGSSKLDQTPGLSYTRRGVHGVSADAELDPTGVGAFNRDESKIYVLGASDESTEEALGSLKPDTETIDSLHDWQEAMDHRVRPEDILSLALPSVANEAAEQLASFVDPESQRVNIQDVITEIGEHPEMYPVDYGRLLVLLPASLGAGSRIEVMFKDLVQGMAIKTDFTTRLQLIYNVVERLDYSFYATPKGDIVAEMPLYAFDPSHFGEYGDRYIYPREDIINIESHFTDDDIRTIFASDYNLLGLYREPKSSEIRLPPGVFPNEPLMHIFGARLEYPDPQCPIPSKEAAEYYAALKMTQINSNAWKQNVSVIMRMGVGPNRPCYFEPRDFIATTRSVSTAIQWGLTGSVSQDTKLNYRRGWSGQIDDQGRHLYEPFGGYAAVPIDYSLLLKKPPPDKVEPDTSTKEISDQKETEKSPEVRLSEIEERNRRIILHSLDEIAKELNDQFGYSLTGGDLIKDPDTSLHRTEEYNDSVGGDGDSLHLIAAAADIGTNTAKKRFGLTKPQIQSAFEAAKRKGRIPEGQWLDEGDHFHYQVRSLRRTSWDVPPNWTGPTT